MTFTTSWLDECGLHDFGYRHWWIEIEIGAESDAQLELSISRTEWGVRFRRGTQQSSIRFTSASCDIGCDDLGILDDVATLSRPGSLIRMLEQRFDLVLRRHDAMIRSNLPDAPKVVRNWLVAI